MKLFIFALLVSFLPALQASANVASVHNTASNQMKTLDQSIAQLQATASALGHVKIVSRCSQARQQLSYATTSWGGISSFFSSPWRARTSSSGYSVQNAMSACGNHLDWLYRQPQLQDPRYSAPVANCRRRYDSCQSTCNQIWTWPCPPGYHPPTPSQYSSFPRQKRDKSIASCPKSNEIACPISANTTGHECLDTQTEITSCGGCSSLDEGENCMEIEGADEVGCEAGQCVIFSPAAGYVINEESGRPEPISSS